MPNEHLQPRTAPLVVGDEAPDFTLPDQNRQDWTLSEHVKRGDVVLCFYPLNFTSVCSTEMRCVSDEFEKAEAAGLTVVGISCDSFASSKAWAEQTGIRQRLLADMHRRVCKAYGLYWPELNVAQRGTVIVGRDASGRGRVRWAQAREPGSAMDIAEVFGHAG